ncbi:TrmB family transcriptional regulator [Streptomyces sp. YC504]|uniref:TrmB family transcriptional regulator n=1 Tax=Streptomyces mesophilus TaxID=1775132 RepID=A0A6G4XU98_9ACTN|nr:TrmB family transcriptional regulator [Streptomyces mesophilus]NGO80181.1 TrmB family transcriptional regulator [Streptomyces mesophilus]
MDDQHVSAQLHGYAAALDSLDSAETQLAAVRDRLTSLALTGSPGLPALPGGLAEVIQGERAQRHHIDRLQREARSEVLMFVRPPYLSAENPIEEERLAAGVAYRALYEGSALAEPAMLGTPRFIAVGEQARSVPRLPVKLMIVDGEHAVIPLNSDQRDFVTGGMLLLHRSILLDAMIELFENHWARGVPLRLGAEGEVHEPSHEARAPDIELLSLLLSGLPDKAIASQLNISLRTLQRRIRALMEVTGTSTRTQLAWYAAHQRWV